MALVEIDMKSEPVAKGQTFFCMKHEHSVGGKDMEQRHDSLLTRTTPVVEDGC